MKNKTKKVLAMICLLLILLTSLPLQAIATFITDINSNAIFGVIPGSLSKTYRELHYATYDGETYIVFCTEWDIDSPNGSEYIYNSDFIAQFKEDRLEYEKIAEMIFFGYTMTYGTGLPTTDEAYIAACCTQQYVWEYIHNNIDNTLTYSDRDDWNPKYMSSSIYADWLSKTESYYNQYHTTVSFSGSQSNIVIGNSITITDTNGVLKNFATFSETIDGVTFSHTKGSNDLLISVSSDCSVDTITFNSANYDLYELLPDGSEYSSSSMSNYVYFQFKSGDIQNLIFSNYVDPSAFSITVEVESGNVLIRKTNTEGDSVEGCTFELYTDKSCTQLVGTGTSDSNGQIKFERLAMGTYYIKETGVPKGYLLDTEVKTTVVNNGETAEVTFKNNEPTGSITLEKTDVDTGNDNRADGTSHHGDANLSGAVYTLYANEDIYNVAKTIKYFSKGEEIATYTFDEYGKATIEITNTTTVANLTGSGDTLEGLPMGSYYSYETSVPEGYNQDDNTYIYDLTYKDMYTSVITINETVTNTVQKAKFEVIKISSNTNTTAEVIADAEFTAILTKYVDYYGSFEEALQHLEEYAEDEYSIFTTDETGHGISGFLAYGEYTVYETYTPNDKIETVEPFYITIDENSDGVIKEFIENDTPFESYVKIVKIDEDTGKTVVLNDTTFTLYKLNETTNEWEQVSCKLGKESYNSWTTDETGTAYTETKLSAGTYKVEELVVPDGYLELSEEIIFEISKSNKTIEFDEDYDAYITVYVKNSKPSGTLIIDKTVALREDVDTSLVDISDLSGIKFKLTAKKDIIDMADGAILYYAGDEIGIYNLDENGDLTINNLYMGTYELEEIETLDGLALNNKKYEVNFTQEDTVTKVYEEKLDIENETTVVEFSKTDITGEEELIGAKLTVLDENNEVIDTWISGEKTHIIEGLEVGKTYILREEITPDGYTKATDIQFTVENSSEIQKVTMIDKIVEIVKTDLVTGDEVEGAELQIIDKDGNIIDEWTSSTEPHKVSGLIEGEEYTLIEITSPYGYEIAESITFTVSYDKETQLIEMKDTPILASVQVEKVDKNTGEHIKSNKFTFGIYEDEECTKLIEEVGANEFEGTALFENLRYGTYYIKELQAPLGYSLSEQIVTVVIDETGVYADGVSLEETDGVYSFIYYNSLMPAIQTGNEVNYTLLFILAIVSLIGLLIGIVILRKKRKKGE